LHQEAQRLQIINLNAFAHIVFVLRYRKRISCAYVRKKRKSASVLAITCTSKRFASFSARPSIDKRSMRSWLLILLLALVAFESTLAFVPATNSNNKRETKRPAFSKPESSIHSQTSSLAFSASNGALTEASHYSEDDADEEAIGYATALVSCALALTLGFGLGYGT
jgi:hypothetical protein